jgi:hypothetical protein
MDHHGMELALRAARPDSAPVARRERGGKMKRITILFAAGLFILAATTLPAMRALAQQAVVTDENMDQMIENAKTPADHEAIAKYYDQKAAQNDAELKMHQEQVKAYATNPRLSTMQMHCGRLIDLSKEQAKENRELAHDHRMMAKPMSQ